jgi:predicted nucleic acid-binding protein
VSQAARLPRAVLDADIIFSRVLHEPMGRVADDLRLLDLLWSEELLAEARRSLIEKKGLSEKVAGRWVGYLSQSFPTGRVDISTVPQDLDLRSLTRDAEDFHVCALAIAGNADYLFTFDRGYLKEPLRLHSVEVPDLDEFLVRQCKEQPQAFRQMIEEQAEDWRGGRPVEELLAALERANVPELVGALSPLLDLPR